MKAVLVTAPGTFEFIDMPAPQLEAGKVIIRPLFISICGSDWPTVNHGRDWIKFPLNPGQPGHEVVAEVVASDAPGFEVGDKVLDIGYSGSARELLMRSPAEVLKLPEKPSLEELVCAQPLGVVVRAAQRWPSMLGKSACVIGQGAIGQFFTMLLQAQGAGPIITLDKEDGRLVTSKKMGATHTINVDKEDPIQAVKDLTGGKGADFVIEAVGTDATYNQIKDLVRMEGLVQFFGMPKKRGTDLFLWELMMRNPTVLMTQRGNPKDFQMALDMIGNGKAYVKPLLTHKFGIHDIPAAFQMAESRADNAIKITMECTW